MHCLTARHLYAFPKLRTLRRLLLQSYAGFLYTSGVLQQTAARDRFRDRSNREVSIPEPILRTRFWEVKVKCPVPVTGVMQNSFQSSMRDFELRIMRENGTSNWVTRPTDIKTVRTNRLFQRRSAEVLTRRADYRQMCPFGENVPR